MKKWWIVLGTCLVLGLSVLGMRQVQQVQIVSAQTLHQHPVIIIDPGHGGMDGGAQANGVTEKDVNLAVSLTLRDLLSQQGFHVIMTSPPSARWYAGRGAAQTAFRDRGCTPLPPHSIRAP